MKTALNRRNFLKRLGASTAVLAGIGLKTLNSKAEKRPNIVFIYTDDLDFDEITPYEVTKFPCYTGAKKLGTIEFRMMAGSYRTIVD